MNKQWYGGWDNICLGEAEDHPSTMAARAVSKALEMAGIQVHELDLVVSTGVTRDFKAPWSVATEVLHQLGIQSPTALGLDLNCGCVSLLVATEIAKDWLTSHQLRYAAVVSAEKWTQDVELANQERNWQLWQYSDGAAALVVGPDVGGPRIASYEGLMLRSHLEFNRLMMQKYGGTRYPQTPTPGNPIQISSEFDQIQVAGTYLKLLREVIDELLRETRTEKIDFVIPTQLNPSFVNTLGALKQLKGARVLKPGKKYGHVGGADVIIGLEALWDENQLSGTTLLLGITPYLFGAALLRGSSERIQIAEESTRETEKTKQSRILALSESEAEIHSSDDDYRPAGGDILDLELDFPHGSSRCKVEVALRKDGDQQSCFVVRFMDLRPDDPIRVYCSSPIIQSLAPVETIAIRYARAD